MVRESFLKSKRIALDDSFFIDIGIFVARLLRGEVKEGCLVNGIFNFCYVLFVFIRRFYLFDKINVRISFVCAFSGKL